MAQTALYDGVFGSYNIRQITNTDYQPNLQEAVSRYSGGLDPQMISILSGDPLISVTSQDIHTHIGSVSATAGLALPSGTITIPWQARAAGGTFAAGSNHYTLSATSGLLVPSEFSADQDGDEGATVKLEIYPSSSTGLVNPVAVNASQALGAQAFVNAYDLGPSKINSTILGMAKSARCIFGLECQKKRYNGETWARQQGITINVRNPKFEFTFESAEDLAAFDHYSALATTATQFFRKRSDGDTHVADATAEHIAVTITGGIQILQGASGSGQDDASFTRTIIGKTLAFSRTSAIA